MSETPKMTSPPRPSHTQRLLMLLGLILLVPLLLVFMVFPLLMEQPFDSVEQIRPEQIKSLRVQILNRSEIDDGDDIPPFYADPADYELLLTPLLSVPKSGGYQDARGPWFGDYRIITKDGRRGTIKLYYVKQVHNDSLHDALLRFQIGVEKFEGGSSLAVVNAVKMAASRGRTTP